MANFTKSDFAFLASVFKTLAEKSRAGSRIVPNEIYIEVVKTANFFSKKNPAFNRAKFYDACGFGE